ncbi:MAG: hypothetical protein AAF788_00770 [Pseudomonadota bacterium]
MGAASRFEDRSGPIVVERFYDHGLTGRQRAGRLFARIFGQALRLILVALPMVPLLLTAVVTVDLPFSALDGVTEGGVVASTFISRGDAVFALVFLMSVIMARRFGASLVTNAAVLAWCLTGGAMAALLIELAPELHADDFPSTRVISALLVSWFFAHVVGVQVYDLTRGGAWWRAPFFGALTGFTFQAVLYFPIAYAGAGAPWVWWLTADIIIMATVSAVFVFVYALFRGLIRPRSGLGGR